MTPASHSHRRPPPLRRCWLFLPGAERAQLLDATKSGADMLIQELEDFTPPERRPEARAMAPELYAAWRAAGVLAAVRINPLETEGRIDLAAVMRGRQERGQASSCRRDQCDDDPVSRGGLPRARHGAGVRGRACQGDRPRRAGRAHGGNAELPQRATAARARDGVVKRVRSALIDRPLERMEER